MTDKNVLRLRIEIIRFILNRNRDGLANVLAEIDEMFGKTSFQKEIISQEINFMLGHNVLSLSYGEFEVSNLIFIDPVNSPNSCFSHDYLLAFSSDRLLKLL